jgi:hypothetical protein
MFKNYHMKNHYKIYSLVFFICFNLFSVNLFAQYKLYEDRYQGGVTAGGYSPGTGTPGVGFFSIHIPPNSFVRKAYLLAGKQGPVNSVPVILNGNTIVFDSTTEYASFYSMYGGIASAHAVDITSIINATDTNYTLDFPGGNTSDTYTDFYMYVAYMNEAMDVVNTAVFLNTSDFADSVLFHMNLVNPLTAGDIGLSLGVGYMCDVSTDGEYIYVNGTYIGKIGGRDINNIDYCAGTMGSFYYDMDTLHALNDDVADLAMDSSDALSNIQTLVMVGDTIVDVLCIHDSIGTQEDNSIWFMTMAYSDKPVGIHSIQKTEVNIYPNPVKDELLVTLKDNEHTEICIYDVASRLLIWKTFNRSASINLSGLQKGVYLYDLRNKNGEIKRGKIVKE